MIDEISVIFGGAVVAALSGVIGLVISWAGMRRAETRAEWARENLAWEKHRSDELTRNLLVLEMASDQVESTAVDIAVRARLTPAEIRLAIKELTEAQLLEEPTPNLVRLTDGGYRVLAEHKFEFEDSVLQRSRGGRSDTVPRSTADLDLAIEDTVKSLRAQHAH